MRRSAGVGLLAIAVGVGSAQPPMREVAPPPRPVAERPPVNLLDARKAWGRDTAVRKADGYKPDGRPNVPPEHLFRIVRYPSPAGDLAAYLSVAPSLGKHPAVVWAHGGTGGINGGVFWSHPTPADDQSAAAFRLAGCVLLVPSWRGENDNPGRYELFYGEVDDLLAAVEYARRLPQVDPDRVYLAGHDTGGTLVLLAAATGCDRFRAGFAFGGSADLRPVVAAGGLPLPFDPTDPDEVRLRSAVHFGAGVARPTFYFEGTATGDGKARVADARRMEAAARAVGAPLSVTPVPWADHYTLLHPLTRAVAKKIVADAGSTCRIRFTAADLAQPRKRTTR
jgi:dipeptidyl aminopeptidase/acylaminoacyl peptidase